MLERILPVLAMIVAVFVVVVAVVELDSRSDDDQRAIAPTTIPSPSDAPSPTAIPSPTQDVTDEPVTDTPEPTLRRTAAAPAPATSVRSTPSATAAEPTPTVAPPRTPTPEPAITAGPINRGAGRTPHTGGSSLLPGLVLAAAAALMRTRLARRR